MTRVRAVAADDYLARPHVADGTELGLTDAIVMIGDRVVLVSGVSTTLLNFVTEWRSLDEVVDTLIQTFGTPPGRTESIVTEILETLEAAGLIEMERATPGVGT